MLWHVRSNDGPTIANPHGRPLSQLSRYEVLRNVRAGSKPVLWLSIQDASALQSCPNLFAGHAVREGWSWSVISSRTNLAPALPSAVPIELSFDRPHSWDDDSDFFSDFEDRFCSEEATLIG